MPIQRICLTLLRKRRMIDRALAVVGDKPDVSTWLFQAVRELNVLKTAMTDV